MHFGSASQAGVISLLCGGKTGLEPTRVIFSGWVWFWRVIFWFSAAVLSGAAAETREERRRDEVTYFNILLRDSRCLPFLLMERNLCMRSICIKSVAGRSFLVGGEAMLILCVLLECLLLNRCSLGHGLFSR